MKKAFALVSLLMCLSPLVEGQQNSASPSAVALTHVTIIDTTGAPSQTNMTVVIEGKRITGIGESGKIRTPKGAQVVDATGKFLIPGLWDMHVHPHGKDYLPLFIANGVTGMRIMWGDPENFEWRKEVDAGTLVAPHMLIASPIIDGPRPYWRGSVAVSSEAEARQAVAAAKQSGADFVKVLTFLPREEYFAIADEAKKEDIPFEGHVPMAVSADEASNAGQKSFEHLTGILVACSTHSDEILAAASSDLAEYLGGGKRQFEGPRVHALRAQMFDTYDPEKASALFELFKKNGTWQTPTLTLWHMFSLLDNSAFTNDERLKYVPVRERESWNPAKLAADSLSENTALTDRQFEMDMHVVAAMEQAGVGILAGTDTGNPYCIPGFALHDELKLLTRAGLAPIQALQTATLNPARFMGNEKDFGSVSKGKVADLVLLDADPLLDIGNTDKIAAVIFDGQLIERPALDRMLAGVEARASRKPIGEVMRQVIQDKNVEAAVAQYRELKKSQPDAYDFNENELITLGYQLLSMKRVTDAIEVFKLSVEEYPQSYNTYDSLAEAYMNHGDKDLAIQNYKKSLELKPSNRNATEMLKKLAAQ